MATTIPPIADDKPALQINDIQAIVLSGYGHLPYAAYLFFYLPRAAGRPVISQQARAALQETLGQITGANHERDRAKRAKSALNVAFTYPGLAALGHTDATLGTFPPEFRGGMTESYRSRALGDVAMSDPKNWEWGGTGEEQKMPDILFMCFAETGQSLEGLADSLKRTYCGIGAELVADEYATPEMHKVHEHFGFRDNITSVQIEGGFGTLDPGQSCIRAGEFILGYENEYGRLPASPHIVSGAAQQKIDIGKNGSYLVFRKLEQDVPKFWRYCTEQAEKLIANEPHQAKANIGEYSEFIGAKIVGRWRSGAPLTLSPFHDDKSLGDDPQRVNDFLYAEQDPHGFGCPLGAHIRRSNPRDLLSTLSPTDSQTVVNHHRILRRGRPYGKPLANPAAPADDCGKRGLLFFCVGANISRQFEFVQQTWLMDGKFARMWNEPDPLTGTPDTLDEKTAAGAEFTIPQATVRLKLQDVPRFVTVRAGLYLFLPGMTSLRILIANHVL